MFSAVLDKLEEHRALKNQENIKSKYVNVMYILCSCSCSAVQMFSCSNSPCTSTPKSSVTRRSINSELLGI